MKKIWFLALIFSVCLAGTAHAAEEMPVLKQAKIKVSFDRNGVKVMEEVTISNVQAIESGKVEHILTQFSDADVADLEFTWGDIQLGAETTKGDIINKLSVPVPQGSTGDFSYMISYRFTKNTDVNRIPLVVPTIASDGTANVVSLTLDLPQGKYLHNSFPIIDAGDSGTVVENMINMPNFVSLELSSTPAGFFKPSNLYTMFGLLVILGFIGAWILNERRVLKGGEVNV